jgi:hypothetical protein
MCDNVIMSRGVVELGGIMEDGGGMGDGMRGIADGAEK